MKPDHLQKIVSMMIEEFQFDKTKGIEGFAEEWIKDFALASPILGFTISEQDADEIISSFVTELKRRSRNEDV